MALLFIALLMVATEAPPAEPGGDAMADEDPSRHAPALRWTPSLLMRYGAGVLSVESAPRAKVASVSDGPILSHRAVETGLVLTPLDTSSTPRDPWLAYDKLQHVTFGVLGTLSAQYVLTEKAGASSSAALGISAGTAAAASVGKELYDRRDGRFFSVRDLVADTLGIGLAAGLIVL